MRIEARLLGVPTIRCDGKLVHLALRKTLGILTYLLLHRGTPIARAHLATLFWPDDDEAAARANVRRHLHQLDKALPSAAEPWFVADTRSVRWNERAHIDFDVATLEEIAAGRGDDAALADLYGGDLCESYFEEWIVPERERLRQLALETLMRSAARARGAGDLARSIARLQAVLRIDPYREDALRALVRARYDAGDRAGALAEYDAFVDRLRAEIDVDPMPESVALYDAIVRYRVEASDAQASDGDERHLLPFAGRTNDLATLNRAWHRAASGRGSVVTICGEAGIGKSRLIREFAAKVEVEGGRVLVGTTSAPELVPYEALAEIFRLVAPELTRLDLDPGWLAALAAIVPEFCAYGPGSPSTTRLFDAIALATGGLARARPLVIVLEDLHWAGTGTAQLFADLARRLVRTPVLLVATFRDEALARAHPLRAGLAKLTGKGTFSIGLGRLDARDVAVVVAASSLAGDDPEIARALHERSEGNPLFLGELVRAYRSAVDLHSPALPDSIDAIIRARVAHLPDAARALADLAATIGATFGVDVLRDVSGWPLGEVLGAVDDLLDRFVIRETATGSRGDYAFTHHLVRSSLYDAIDPLERARRHRRIARVLDERLDAARPERAHELARHYALAGDAARAAHFEAEIARYALDACSLDDAAAAVSRGLAFLADTLGDERETRYALLDVRESVAARTGDWRERQTTIAQMTAIARELPCDTRIGETLERAVRAAHDRNDRNEERACIDELAAFAPSRNVRWAPVALECEAMYAEGTGENAATFGAATAAAAAYREANDVAGQIRALALVATSAARLGHAREAEAALDDAKRLADETGAYAQRTLVTATEMALAQLAYDDRRQFAVASASLHDARANGDRVAELAALQSMATVSGSLWNVAESLGYYAETIALAGVLGSDEYLGRAYNNRAGLRSEFGDLSNAVADQEQAEVHAGRAGNRHLETICADNLACFAELRGDATEVRRQVARARALVDKLGVVRIRADFDVREGIAAIIVGDDALAIARLTRAIALRREEENRTYLAIDLPFLAFAAARAGDVALARSCVDEAVALIENRAWNTEFRRSLWFCSRTYKVLGDDARATAIVARAHRDLLDKRAALAACDVTLVAHFDALDANVAIVCAATRGVWPARDVYGAEGSAIEVA